LHIKLKEIMFYALSWFAVLSLFAMWSLAAWAFHAVALWTVSSAGVLAGKSAAMEVLRLPEWLAASVPPELALAVASFGSLVKPTVDALLGWMPSLGGGLSLAVWAVWAVGAGLLLLLGVALSVLIAVLRRNSAAAPSQRVSSALMR
jgi:hypothetical protein